MKQIDDKHLMAKLEKTTSVLGQGILGAEVFQSISFPPHLKVLAYSTLKAKTDDSYNPHHPPKSWCLKTLV